MVDETRHHDATSHPSSVPPRQRTPHGARRVSEGRWTKWGVVFGALGAAAGLVALWPAFVGKGADAGPAGTGQPPGSSVTTAANTPSGGTTATGSSTATGGAGRALVGLPLARGAGAVHRDGDDLVMQCGTNQSDDRYREVEYSVPATTSFGRLEATLRASADGGQDQRVALQVFVRDQYARADQTVQQAVKTLAPNGTEALTAPIPQGTAAVVLRLTCYLPGSSLRIIDPHLIGG